MSRRALLRVIRSEILHATGVDPGPEAAARSLALMEERFWVVAGALGLPAAVHHDPAMAEHLASRWEGAHLAALRAAIAHTQTGAA